MLTQPLRDVKMNRPLTSPFSLFLAFLLSSLPLSPPLPHTMSKGRVNSASISGGDSIVVYNGLPLFDGL